MAAERIGEDHTEVGQEGRRTAVPGFGHRISWSHIFPSDGVRNKVCKIFPGDLELFRRTRRSWRRPVKPGRKLLQNLLDGSWLYLPERRFEDRRA